MKLPKELYDLKKMKHTYYILLAIAVVFMMIAVAFLILSIYFNESSFPETMICVAISILLAAQASHVQRSYFLFQKLQEIQGQVNKSKES